MKRVIIGYYSQQDDIPEAWDINEEEWAKIAQEVREFRANSSTVYCLGEFEETLTQYASRHTSLDPNLLLWVEEVE